MAFSDNFIKRPVLTTVCSILIVLMGVIAIPSLPIANLPNIAPPLIQVTASYGGANSLVTEQAVTNPLEQQINGVPGASYISSTSNMEGQSIIQVYFDETTDIDIDQVNVQNRVSLAMPQLPDQVSDTGVSVLQSTPSILLAYQVSSTEGQFDAAYLNGLVYEQLYYPLERVPGVANVNILGGTSPAYRLFVDPNKLPPTGSRPPMWSMPSKHKTASPSAARGRATRLGQSGLHLPAAGGVRQPARWSVQQPDRGAHPHRQSLLKDVGEVRYGFNNYTTAAADTSNHDAISVAVFQTPDSNASMLPTPWCNRWRPSQPRCLLASRCNRCTTSVNSLNPPWRADRCPGPGDRAGDPVRVFAELARHDRAEPGHSDLPGGHLAFIKVFGFSINQLTLLGLVLATGLVVDDAIVIEAVSKISKAHAPPAGGSGLHGRAVRALAATALVLMAVFVPVAFYPGSIGIIYQQFALTIAFS